VVETAYRCVGIKKLMHKQLCFFFFFVCEIYEYIIFTQPVNKEISMRIAAISTVCARHQPGMQLQQANLKCI
jgi:hypothetical protein